MSRNQSFSVASIRETEEVARRLASILRCGDVIGLSGELGAGKSVFVRAAAQTLGVSERMPSPTYTLVEEYEGPICPILHIDLYRLTDPEEFLYLGVEEDLPKAISFVEWIDRSPDLEELATIRIEIAMTEHDVEHRTITITHFDEETSR